jgi:hypothetical protein
MPSNKKRKTFFLTILAILCCGIFVYFIWPRLSGVSYSYKNLQAKSVLNDAKSKDKIEEASNMDTIPVESIPVSHIQTPDVVKAIYLSAWVAGNSKYRDPLIKLIDKTELNAIVIDVKDSTGRVSFTTLDDTINKIGSVEKRIADIQSLVKTLHSKNIYIIGRVAVFQDPFMTKQKPEWSITKKSDGKVWKDKKGLSFLDPANKNVWDYTVRVAKSAYALGFDEINFDYIRYPSDGDLKDINYHITPPATRADNIEKFFTYLSSEMKKDENIPISGDLFGLTTEVNDDMGIGQVWEKAIPHFDFLAPMVYPSHYPSGSSGFKNPAEHPYEIINKAMASAIKKTNTVQGQKISKIRPWIQDFNLGAIYTKDMVQAQIKAVYDNNLTSFMIWDPRNKYPSTALLLENN